MQRRTFATDRIDDDYSEEGQDIALDTFIDDFINNISFITHTDENVNETLIDNKQINT